jgi:hypothetical protein
MALPFRIGGQSFVQRRTSIGQLLQKMTPFVLDLPDRDTDPGSQSSAPELTTIENIPASSGLYVNAFQVGTDGGKRSTSGSEEYRRKITSASASRGGRNIRRLATTGKNASFTI